MGRIGQFIQMILPPDSGHGGGSKRALELNPNYATAHHWHAIFLASIGRSEEGLAQIRKARELDPLSAIINFQFGRMLEESGRFDEALAEYKKVNEFDPAFANAYWNIAEHYRSVSERWKPAGSSGLFQTSTEVIRSASAAVHSPEMRSSLVIDLSVCSSSAGFRSP